MEAIVDFATRKRTAEKKKKNRGNAKPWIHDCLKNLHVLVSSLRRRDDPVLLGSRDAALLRLGQAAHPFKCDLPDVVTVL
jgi:hypothetical protein